MVPPDPARVEMIRDRLVETPFTMNASARAIVERAIRDDCVHRNWRLLALHVGVTHIHVVVDACGVAPEQMVQRLKSWATRRLKESGLTGSRRRFWTNQASTRWLWNADDIAESVDYVTNRQ
jgi:REP element-mobilizing transposase RayT